MKNICFGIFFDIQFIVRCDKSLD